jgi:multicomponent Na+:H+ antiporter subunit B
MTNNSEIISKITGLLYPFIIIFGFYIILNGHLTPGGGFQGGAVLASIFIAQYLVDPNRRISLTLLKKIEIILFFLIILYPILFLFLDFHSTSIVANLGYLIIMNTLIGLKVFCGFTIIFFRFIFFEAGI